MAKGTMNGSGLIGVVIGGVIGIAGSFLPHLYEKQRARKSARAVARAYVSGILKMEEIRKHSSLYERNVEALEAGTSQSLMKIFGAEEASPDLEIQKALINQLGLLEPGVAQDMVVFGNMLAGLRIDLKAISLGQLEPLSVAEKIRILKLDLKLWNDTLDLGRDLVRRLK
jgi:hypothetical protein